MSPPRSSFTRQQTDRIQRLFQKPDTESIDGHNFVPPNVLSSLQLSTFRVAVYWWARPASGPITGEHTCSLQAKILDITHTMEGQSENDELYPIAVLIDELKARCSSWTF